MKIIHIFARNFGSYEDLAYNFGDGNLTLISGSTGSGKSTIPDMVCWALYGVTAKNGNADDVISWQSDGEPTVTTIEVELNGQQEKITITRTRGVASKKQNDLFWTKEGFEDAPIRGKDLIDSQRLLEAILGIDAETFIASAYFHEFSNSGHFFLANAKGRRALLERITDLSFPDRLQGRAAESSKELRSKATVLERELLAVRALHTRVQRDVDRTVLLQSSWDSDQKIICSEIEIKDKNFKKDQAKKQKDLQSKIESLEATLKEESELADNLALLNEAMEGCRSTRCGECGGPKENKHYEELRKAAVEISYEIHGNAINIADYNNLKEHLDQLLKAENPHGKQLAKERKRANPYAGQLKDLQQELATETAKEASAAKELEERRGALEQLSRISDLAVVLKGRLLQNAIRDIEANTNKHLEQFFDSEIRVLFNAESGDGIEVGVYKDGFNCNYKQLSKGQRGLLKLCFASAVMEAASNKSGVHMNCLFFDEALDGLDVSLKVKAYRLFEQLSKNRDSVIVIDHCEELKLLFEDRYNVTMVDGHSILC